MSAEIIPLRPKHQVVIDSRHGLLVAISMIRAGGHDEQTIDLILSKVSDDLYDYVETLEGR